MKDLKETKNIQWMTIDKYSDKELVEALYLRENLPFLEEWVEKELNLYAVKTVLEALAYGVYNFIDNESITGVLSSTLFIEPFQKMVQVLNEKIANRIEEENKVIFSSKDYKKILYACQNRVGLEGLILTY